MKIIAICVVILGASLAACNSNKQQAPAAVTIENKKDTVSPGNDLKASASATIKPVSTFPQKEILNGYLQLKNALANDNSKEAATAGNAIVSVLAKVDTLSLSGSQQKVYADLQDDAREHAEHIGANPGKLDHQREHFEMLSKDVNDLIKNFGNGGQTLYRDFCPMANDGKGASWISEVKEIKNPYMGKKMATCGSVKETFK